MKGDESHPTAITRGIRLDDQNNVIYIDADGQSFLISSPYIKEPDTLRADTLLPQGYLFYGASLNNQGLFEIHFVRIKEEHVLSTWIIDSKGRFLGQYEQSEVLGLLLGHPKTLSFTTNFTLFARAAQRHLNDLQVYSLIKYVLGFTEAALEYINSLGPEQPNTNGLLQTKKVDRSVLLIVLYNHCYARNIKLIDKHYNERFSAVWHVLPNVAPSHPRCFSYPYGSFQYHHAIVYALRSIGQLAQRPNWVLVIQDDVLLHPRVNEEFLLASYMMDDRSSCFYQELSVNHDSHDSWCWNQRVANSCIRQKDILVGNGFEGPSNFLDENSFSRGVSDVFALNCKYVDSFNEILSLYSSANVFPEVSVPTTLMAIAKISGLPHTRMPGIYFDANSIQYATDEQWLRSNFYRSENLFIHPIKLSKASHAG